MCAVAPGNTRPLHGVCPNNIVINSSPRDAAEREVTLNRNLSPSFVKILRR